MLPKVGPKSKFREILAAFCKKKVRAAASTPASAPASSLRCRSSSRRTRPPEPDARGSASLGCWPGPRIGLSRAAQIRLAPTLNWVANNKLELSKFNFRFRRARKIEIMIGDYWKTLRGSFSAVSKPIFASKYALESSRRDLHNALLCTVLKSHFF